ncbi:MAG: FHA domain-containing protein [Gemmataceae bacterium]|nr:FHA domain-containing protein [Gemmataceae bacterium]
MVSLKVVKGYNEGREYPLEGEKFSLGRSPDCQIVIPVTSVSREHAYITRVKAQFFIEDNKSKNGTFINNQQIASKVLLKNNDQIRICDFVLAFNQPLAPTVNYPEPASEEDDGGEVPSSTVQATINASNQQLLETQPAEKLRLLLEITSTLAKVLQLDQLLPTIVDCMFQLFKQADRCFIILADATTNKFIPKVIRTRRQNDEANARFSKSIVRQCLEENQAFLSDDASSDSRVQSSQSVVDFRIRSVMCVPLTAVDGKPFGVIQVDTQDRSKKFTQDDLKLLWGVANQSGAALENAKFHQNSLSQERIKRDLELANQVQLSFLPTSFPKIPHFEFAAHYQPAQQVGGDYYGFVPLKDNCMAVTVGDVAGKGVAAALFMAKLSSETRLALITEPTPKDAIIKLNEVLYPHTSQLDRFVTLITAILNPESNTVSLVNAGHMSPLLIKGDGSTPLDSVPMETAGLPLGIMDSFPYESVDFILKPGEAILMYSDGVPDAMSVANVAFGTKGLLDCLTGCKDTSPHNVLNCVVNAIRNHTVGRQYPHDDITIVAVSRVS